MAAESNNEYNDPLDKTNKNIPPNAYFTEEEQVQMLSGVCPRHIKKEMLKQWLSYRKGTSRDGSASSDAKKYDLLRRVVSYIKNDWGDNFTDKWQHLSRKHDLATVKSTARSSSSTVTFPGSASWISLVNGKDNVPAFHMQHMVSYFVDRTAKDKEGNKDYKNICSKAFGLFRHGHVQKIEVAADEHSYNCVHFRSECLPEMKKNLKYKLQMSLTKTGEKIGEIVYASCHPCPAGKGPTASCKHIAALCYALEEFVRLQTMRDYQTCTQRLQTWNRPRKRKLDPKRVYDIDFSRKVYGREVEDAKKTLMDPRLPAHRDQNSSNVNTKLLNGIKKVKPNCGFFFLLSQEKLVEEPVQQHSKSQSQPAKSIMSIISPLKQQPTSLKEIFDRASRIRQQLCIDADEREKIRVATQSQSGCSEWFLHRQVRITASNCKRAIQKPSTSPTKAMREILHYNKRFESEQMKQGLKDEKSIVRMYEQHVGCKVDSVGFVISDTHSFLGASPDGEVDGGLMEVKRLFPHSNMSLHDAIVSRKICKASRNGLVVNKTHKFYFQVQLQMFCTNSQWTDLVLSDLRDIVILHIKRSNSFLSKIIPQLQEFYNSHISLELAYPRVAFGLPRLSKLIGRGEE